jgi:putative methionine-R-sulfoxide reductase with GAF domain
LKRTQQPPPSERPCMATGLHRSGRSFAVEFSAQALYLGNRSTPKASIDEALKPEYNFCLFVRDIETFKDGYAELRRRERRYRILSYFAASVFGNDTVSEICWDIAQNCIAELDFEDAVVYLLDAERGVLVQASAFGSGKERNAAIVQPMEIPLGQGIVGSAALTQEIERIADTTLDERYIVDDQPRLSELAVPIVYKGETLGVIDSEHTRKDFFTEEVALIVQQMASIAATKIMRIQAEEKVLLMNEHLESLVTERTQELQEANTEIHRNIEIA